jgi:hypothetical protein
MCLGKPVKKKTAKTIYNDEKEYNKIIDPFNESAILKRMINKLN